MPVIPTLGSQTQEDQELKTSLGWGRGDAGGGWEPWRAVPQPCRSSLLTGSAAQPPILAQAHVVDLTGRFGAGDVAWG